MESFPPANWDVRHLADMDSIEGASRPDKGVMQALLAVAPAENQEGAFKFLLSGAMPVQLHFPVRRLLPQPEFKDFYFDMQLELGTQISIAKNCTSTRWLDIIELLESQDMDVQDGRGEIVTDQFLTRWRDLVKADKKLTGLSWRWVLGYRSTYDTCVLIAQGLPCSTKQIEGSQYLKAESAPGVVLATYELSYNRYTARPYQLNNFLCI